MCECFQRSIFGAVQQRGERGLPGNGFLIDSSGDLDAGGRKIRNIADGTTGQDVVSKKQVTINNANTEENLLNAKGDMFVYDSVQAKIVKKLVGTDGQSLVADSAQDDGTSWILNNSFDTIFVNNIQERDVSANIRMVNKVEIGDADFTMSLEGSNPRTQYDGGDRWDFNRTGGIGSFGLLTFRIDGAPNPELTIESTAVTVKNILNIGDTNTSITKTTTGANMGDVTLQFGDNLGVNSIFYDDSAKHISFISEGATRLRINNNGVNFAPQDPLEKELSSYQTDVLSVDWLGTDTAVNTNINIEKIGNTIFLNFEVMSNTMVTSNSSITSTQNLPPQVRPSSEQMFTCIVQQDSNNISGRLIVSPGGLLTLDKSDGSGGYTIFAGSAGGTAGWPGFTVSYIK